MKHIDKYAMFEGKGRPVGTNKTDEDFLLEYEDVVECLKMGYTVRAVIEITGSNNGTVQKVRNLIKGYLNGLEPTRLKFFNDDTRKIFLRLKSNKEIIGLLEEGKTIRTVSEITKRRLKSVERVYNLIKNGLDFDPSIQNDVVGYRKRKVNLIEDIVFSDILNDSQKISHLKDILKKKT